MITRGTVAIPQGEVDMTVTELKNKLKTSGQWRTGLVLEPFDWLQGFGPADALTGVVAYRLIDPNWRPARGEGGRNWEPVLSVKQEVWVGASREMLAQLLAAADYFDRPSEFQNLLLLQLHRFALDFYQGYELRENNFVYANDQLTITGEATTGSDDNLVTHPFTTIARRDGPVQFTITD
ncbi:MAG: hypothetical protein V9G20_14670 [Candidatus Promineifilaceae bacterium]|nr:hypothetical protein [Chloroflexota bacterium]